MIKTRLSALYSKVLQINCCIGSVSQCWESLHWLPLVITRFPSITIVYFTFPMAHFIWPWCLLGGYSSQAIKELNYELKLADDPCKLLSLTYYNLSGFTVTQLLSPTLLVWLMVLDWPFIQRMAFFTLRPHHPGHLSLIHIWRCRRSYACRSRWSPYH